MSTFYYAACDTHRVISGVIAGRSFPDRWWTESDSDLGAFLADHAACRPRIISEHDGAADEYAEMTT